MSGLNRFAPALRLARRQASTHAHDKHAIWREINRLGSEGKWDSVNNAPNKFLFGHAKKEAYAAYNKINHNTDFWSQSAWGQYMKVVWRVALLLGIIKGGVVAYEFIVPEQKRLHYKYRAHHSHHGDEHHGHEEAAHH